MDQLPLVNFENNRVRVFVKTLLFALIVKSGSLEGRRFNYGKKGEFLNT